MFLVFFRKLIFFCLIYLSFACNYSYCSNFSQGIDYSIKFSDNVPTFVLEKMQEVSVLILNKKRLLGSLGGLINRAENDKLLFEQVLQHFCYYSGKIDLVINTKSNPVEINFNINLGERYKLKKIEVESINKINIVLDHELEEILNLKSKEYLNADDIIIAKRWLEKYFFQKGYPYLTIYNPEVIINEKDLSFTLVYKINLQGQGIINDSIIISDKKKLNTQFISNRLFWKNGDIYDSRVVEKTRRYLIQTGLFNSVVIKPVIQNKESLNNANNESENTQIPLAMEVNVSESSPRAISAGVHYDTTQKLEARLSWDHYNLMGHGENLGVSVRGSKIRNKIRLHYDIPDCLSAKQTWRNEIFAMKESTLAYKGNTYEGSTKLERYLADELIFSFGISPEFGEITQNTNNKKTPIRLIGLPFELRLDASNDLLNPTRGIRLNGIATPYTGKLGGSKGVLIVQGGANVYLPFATNSLSEDEGTLAFFTKIGRIQIEKFSELPFNKRFYGGGNGSIRGYGYQKIGPFDKKQIPLGGQSMLELGSELRCKFSNDLGGALFLEGGNVWLNKMPNFKKDILWGAGLGVRYYTEYAPLRFDLAFPLKRRKLAGEKKSYDSPYQFYVSVGQAF